MTEEVVLLYDEDLPDWANEENRELHALTRERASEHHSLLSDCKELQERVNVLQEHLKSVQTEVGSTQKLLTEKRSLVEAEKHLEQLAEREYGKIMSETAKVQNDTDDVSKRVSAVESRIAIGQGRINQFMEEAKLNEQELEQWKVIARQKEEDFLVLQRYQVRDETHVRSMLLEIEKATAIIEGKKVELEQEVTRTRALQIELDMTAEQFRKMHEERQRLLAQWEGQIEKMRSLNDAIERTTQIHEERKQDVYALQNAVKNETKVLDRAEKDNLATERQLTIGDHQVSQRHKVYEKETEDLSEFKETVETQRHQLDKLESDGRAYEEEIRSLREMAAREVAKREAYQQRLHETEDALATQKDQTGELAGQTDLMNDFLKKEEAELKRLEGAIIGEKKEIFRLSQQAYNKRKIRSDLLAEIEGSQSRAKNLALKIQELDRETQKQMELLYNSNFHIQQMERKIARIEGERTEEEKLELQTQIDHLSKVLDGKLEMEKMLSQQLNRLDLDLRQTMRRKETLDKAKHSLEIKLNELHLDQDSLDKSTVKARTQKENVLVRLNMLRLQVEKLGEQVATKSDELISLENRRQQLQLSMEERVLEIDGHLAALRTQLKTEEEARHQATIELTERKKRADTLASKYEVMMGKYKVDGEEVSQTEHVVRFAREREEVSRRGDELEVEVKTAIRELRALERQMEKLNGKNRDLRVAFATVGENDNDMEKKRVLEEQVRVAQGRLNACRGEAHSAAEQRQAMEKTYQQQQTRIAQMQGEINKMRPVVERLSGDNHDLSEKIKRAGHMLTKAKEAHRKSSNVPPDSKYPATLLEMDVELRMLKSAVESAVGELTRLAEGNREMEPKLRMGLTQMGLTMKQLGPTLASPKGPTIVTPTSSRSGASNRSAGSYKSMGSMGSRGSRGSRGSNASRGSVASVKNLGFPG